MKDYVIACIVVWGICGLVGSAIGSEKGRGGDGFILGLLFGPFGVLIIAVMAPTLKKQVEINAKLQQAAAPAAYMSTPAGWYPDPHRRHQWRFWNGHAWGTLVADNGVQSHD